MAKKEVENKVDMPILVLALAGLAVLGGIIVYASLNTGTKQAEEKTGDSVNTQTSQNTNTTAEETAADKLGANEVKFTSVNFKAEVEDAKGLVLVDVYASWCPHCQKLAPTITAIADEYKGRVKVGKLNANNQTKDVPEVVDNYNFAIAKGLQGYPTVWIYKDGKVVETFSGEKSKDEIKALLDKNL